MFADAGRALGLISNPQAVWNCASGTSRNWARFLLLRYWRHGAQRRYGGGHSEAVAKAVGVKGQWLPDVVDATAGLGRELLCLPAWAARMPIPNWTWLKERLTLHHHGSSLNALAQLRPAPDVVYLDPMFPQRQKSALVKRRCGYFNCWRAGIYHH
ncbi:MAG: Ribosomal RNA small subunit methyltransferase J [Sodalis sp.]|nr:MAG: Ribosomal RNA small subunit methyltransferase J [Sodalis sp.]